MISRNTAKLLLIYLFWIVAHYFSSQYYPKICVPYDLRGFFLSPLMVPSAHCTVMRWMITNGGNNICAGWIFLMSFALDALSVRR